MIRVARRLGALGLLGLVALYSGNLHAFTSFPIEDIRVEGLRRIAPGTVFTYLPVRVGQTMDEPAAAGSVRELFDTGFFKDVRLEREGNVLVVIVSERPAIASIDFTGNEEIETEALEEALNERGFSVGRVFDRSVLEKIERELRNQYFARGKYSVRIKATLTPLERNRVGVSVDISEGKVSRIRKVNIVGNQAFSDEDLLDDFKLADTPWIMFWVDGEKYDKQKLQADIETLKARYLDNGYLRFDVPSTEVTISDDRREIYVTVNVNEGDQYTVKDLKIAGDLPLPAEQLFPLFTVVQGQLISQKEVVKTASAIGDKLGDLGYAFANVNPVPTIDEETKEVSLTFYVDPGKRVQVRRMVLRGNAKTSDSVVRREFRQMESAWYDAAKIERSKQRLGLLGYFHQVDVKTVPVTNSLDQVDLQFDVEEKPTGNLLAGIGYGETSGFVLSASVAQDNFLGTGKRVAAGFNTSSVNTAYTFSFVDPYYTIDGVSRGFDVGFKTTDAEEANLSDYTTDLLYGEVNYGIPVNEEDRITGAVRLDIMDFEPQSSASTEVRDFATQQGTNFVDLAVRLGWSRDTRNRAIFPTRGSLQRISGRVTVPGSDLTYYRYDYEHRYLQPLDNAWVLQLSGELGFGDGYGDLDELPFFHNFFTGGVRSIRGFRANTIGPKDSNGDSLGGRLKTVANAELIMPSPFDNYQDEVRVSAFLDGGAVHACGQCASLDDMRLSTGVGLRWITPVGPMSFAYGIPLREKEGDETQSFQFTLGTDF